MPYIPENQRDTSYYIFHQKFLCTVKYIDTLSIEYIKTFGIHTSGVREIDRDAIGERIQTYLTIAKMAEYFQKGSIVGVVKKSDTKIIYERINDHLEAWRDRIRQGIINGSAPIDDLILLDKLANSVYEHAKYHLKPNEVESNFLSVMNSLQMVSKDSLIGQFKTADKKKADKLKTREEIEQETNLISEVEIPARDSMSDFFAGQAPSSAFNVERY